MTLSLFYILLRRYQKRTERKMLFLFFRNLFTARVAWLMLLTVWIAPPAAAQERLLQYTVTRGSNPVGTVLVRESKQGNRAIYQLQSAIRLSFLFTGTGRALEEAIYENGILIYSRCYQKVKNKEHVYSEIEADGKTYLINHNTEKTLLQQYPITYNLICLYVTEPRNRRTVFADSYSQFVPIERLRAQQYKLTFPDGSYNEYYYENGVCKKVKLYTLWYNAEMTLKTD